VGISRVGTSKKVEMEMCRADGDMMDTWRRFDGALMGMRQLCQRPLRSAGHARMRCECTPRDCSSPTDLVIDRTCPSMPLLS
jgi:hypothetical protein